MSVESMRESLESTRLSNPSASAEKLSKPPSDAALSSGIKPNLSVSIESPSSSPNNGQLLWQQPYSELSRFPSASYRFRGSKEREYVLEGASKYAIPLPSPSEYRSRSLSNALSDVSTDGGESETGGAAGKTPGRTKTLSFFESMDSAFSPPPPPRMPSANYDHSRRDLYSSTSSLPGSSTLPLDSLHIVSPPIQTSRSAQSHTPSLPANTPSIASPSTFQPLSNLPSAFRSEAPRQHPSVPASFGHNRHRSGSHGPSVLGRQMAVSESPLASPTESQSSLWIREPPSRLPTLLSDPTVPTPAPIASTSSTAVSTPSSLHTSSLVSDESPIVASSSMPSHDYEPGNVLDGQYEVVRTLGIGAFSKVVLAKRIKRRPPESKTSTPVTSPKKLQMAELGLKKSISNASLGRGQTPKATNGYGFSSLVLDEASLAGKSSTNGVDRPDEQGGRIQGTEEGFVALKLISRTHIKKNDRMRISIVREVEVLKHIRHPSLVHLTSSFDTAFHTALVLEYSHGGELFDFLANHHEHTSEALVRRIFGELADALGWMHSIGLVHRDLKLENILLTANPFPAGYSPPTLPPDPSSLPNIPTPLVKLTDFGLSRFIDPSSPFLETRCGSEEYAAPELIMGKRYDGRQTDAWALGVVLFALITGYLPFVEDGSAGPQDGPSRNGTSPSAKGSAKSRRNYLLKIAKGEYKWPEAATDTDSSVKYSDAAMMVSEPVKLLAAGLLSRDPKKRIRTEDVWDFEWMQGPGASEKLSVRGGRLEGVSVSAFEREDEAMVRAEIPEGS